MCGGESERADRAHFDSLLKYATSLRIHRCIAYNSGEIIELFADDSQLYCCL